MSSHDSKIARLLEELKKPEEMGEGEVEERRQGEERERQLTEQQRKTTSPDTFENNVPDTPLQSISSSQIGNKQADLEVNNRILDKLKGRVYNNVGGFFERYFEGKSWTVDEAEDAYSMLMVQYVDGRWSGWPEPSFESRFFKWFMMFQDTVLSGLGRRYYTSAIKALNCLDADRKLDIFLAPTDIASSNDMLNWSNVLVIGEHNKNPAKDGSKTTLLKLAGYAREVFGSQPYRRFVLGFTICGSLMRLWVFDRSGAYNSEPFNIHQEPKRFVNVVRGYALMTEAELGLNTFVQKDGTDRYIMANGTKIFLEDYPIASQNDIACRGTTCFRGTRELNPPNWEFVVKFSWTSTEQQREGKLLKLAKEKGVTGIAEWFHHEPIKIDGELDTIVALRNGLKFGRPRVLKPRVDDSARSSLTLRTMSAPAQISTISQTGTSFRGKGGRNLDDNEGNSRKRLKSANETNIPGHSDRAPTSIHSIEDSDTDSLVRIQSGTYNNLIHHCLVVSPAGRPLYTYKCVKEFLEVFRDAILGHRSLLEDANILHRHISEDNIIINESTAERSPKGLLIDLNMAKKLGSQPCGATCRTGTMQFMAIGVLKGEAHTYRHDLESFFYVFIWMCIRYGHHSLPGQRAKLTGVSVLRRWYSETYQLAAFTKLGQMTDFESILAEFSADFVCLKGLAYELRNILFDYPNLAPFIDTYRDPSYMYDGMIDAFNRRLRALETETEQDGAGEIDEYSSEGDEEYEEYEEDEEDE